MAAELRRCEYCRCSPDVDPCKLSDGEECGWWDAPRTCCSGPQCVKARLAARRAGKRATETIRREESGEIATRLEGIETERRKATREAAARKRNRRMKARA